MIYYDKDYLEFDSYGLITIGCMRCNEPIAKRTYIEMPDRTNPKAKVNVVTMQKMGNWQQVKILLSDGSYADPMFCIDCSKHPIDGVGLMKQINGGWKKHMKVVRKSQEDIDKFIEKKKNLKVLRRA